MSIRHLIFDFDGTLYDTAQSIVTVMRLTVEHLRLPAKTDQQLRSVIGLRLEEVGGVLFPENAEMSIEFAAVYREIYKTRPKVHLSHPFPGVIATLCELQKAGCDMAIASSRSRLSLLEFMDDPLFGPFFKLAVGGDDVQSGKPAPDAIELICSRLRWNPEETLMIGDARFDLMMGKNAGVRTCGVTYGNGTTAEIAGESPDYIIDEFRELLPIVLSS